MKVKDACQINPLSKENWDYINYLDTSSVVNDSLVSPFQLIYGTYPSRAQRIIKKDDILISSVRPNLKHNYFVRDLPDHAMASSGFIQVRVRSKDYLPRFVFYYLTNPSMTAHYSSIAESAQTTFPTFNKKVIEEMPIPDIDIAEQRHIVDAMQSRS